MATTASYGLRGFICKLRPRTETISPDHRQNAGATSTGSDLA